MLLKIVFLPTDTNNSAKGAREDEGKAAAQVPHLDRDDAEVGRGGIRRLFEDTGRKARGPQQSVAGLILAN
jgi:hypothetical protein